MKRFIFIAMLLCVGCAYGGPATEPQQDAGLNPWEQAPIPNDKLSYQQPQPQIQWGDQCLVSFADHYDLYTCAIGDPDPPYSTVTGAPCSMQQCIVNQPCYVHTDGGTVTGTCVNNWSQ